MADVAKPYRRVTFNYYVMTQDEIVMIRFECLKLARKETPQLADIRDYADRLVEWVLGKPKPHVGKQLQESEKEEQLS